ncbi:diguanylate cyclase/phosphodiesterase [Halalkalibacter wakoensis JCM 9140]|uniref:histidine kinase n=1 Tax=Halalkalibacter wakoensis JCM 9140 TaxID=1236970 RepID=W4Q8B4_9BACI|nr:EAL domain-containing protein [Halalkalibacter wakoensis]GAE27624.1 diguanylate cyclase/phosphodiesterase [Halalkalibacter wakoensis JCM 9140]
MYSLSSRKRRKLQSINDEFLYKDLFSAYPDALFLIDVNGEFVNLNEGLVQLIGFSKDTLLYSQFKQYIYAEDLSEVVSYFLHALHGKVQDREFRVVHENGSIKEVSVTVVPARINGEILGVYGVAKDISEKKRLEVALKNSEMRFESLIHQSTDVIGILDQNGVIKYQSPAVKQVLGFEPKSLFGKNAFDLVYEEDLNLARCLIENSIKNGRETQKGELRLKTKTGGFTFCEAYVTNLFEDENINGIVVNYRDISSRKQQEEEIQQMAFHDYLTGLPNRFMLEKKLNDEIVQGQEIAVLFIDLDRFKIINDNMGHHVGDLLLKEVTTRLKSCLADNDVLFRQGGDEFIIILTNANRELATAVSTTIVQSLSYPFSINNYDIFTSPSIGISLFPEDGQTVEQLTRNADYAMYQAKKMGRNTFYFYSPPEVDAINPLSIEMELHSALERNELELFYQPKVNMKSGKVVGAEALLRWNHPQWGLVSPATFIPIAEESGLIVSIGEWALREACKKNYQLCLDGYELVISVNLSPRQFTKVNLVQTIEKIIGETGLPPELLELEITESMTANMEQTIDTLTDLKRIGVKISIDDFGTGFSSLNYLKQFPVDTLKIDQSFVRELSGKADEAIVKMIISMAHHLELNVVAEGIETKEQLEFLQQHLCNEGQGFLFSKPVPEGQLINWIEKIENGTQEFGTDKTEADSVYLEESKTEDVKGQNIFAPFQTEKLGVVGELAAGIAHEIRNPITSIKGFIHLIEQGVVKKDYFDVIHSSFQQIEEVLKEFLEVARPKLNERQLVDLYELIHEVVVNIKSKNDVEIGITRDAAIPKIMCDPNKIKEVMSQLLTNSIEAIEQNGFVKMGLRMEKEGIVITVTDNGVGMSQQRLERLGEPFFSNKEKGIGFGLMICYQHIWSHNGTIQVRSIEKEGTQVEVRLPI